MPGGALYSPRTRAVFDRRTTAHYFSRYTLCVKGPGGTLAASYGEDLTLLNPHDAAVPRQAGPRRRWNASVRSIGRKLRQTVRCLA
jgi:hypothetical protein